jgi:hypothetical protein
VFLKSVELFGFKILATEASSNSRGDLSPSRTERMRKEQYRGLD